MSDKIVIKQEKKGAIKFLAAAIIMSLLSLLLLVVDLREFGDEFARMSDVVYYLLKAVFLVGFVFFGYGFFYMLKKTKNEEIVLCVDENGVMDNSSAIAFGFMPWSDIEDVYLAKFVGETYIELKLRNSEYYMEKLPAWKKAMVAANLKMGMEAVSITLNATNENPQEICERMQCIMQQVKSVK